MPYGFLHAEQEQALREVVAGKSVIDIGCGDMVLTRKLRILGATSVLALDKCNLPRTVDDPHIEIVQTSIDKFERHNPDRKFDVGFLSWPVNRELSGLVNLLERCETIVYLGCNVGGSACGGGALFPYFLTRRLDYYRPHPSNSLIVCGPSLPKARLPTGEEYAAIHQQDVYSFTDAHLRAGSSEMPTG